MTWLVTLDIVEARRAAQIEAARGPSIAGAQSDYAVGILSDLADAWQKVSQLTQNLVKAESKATDTSLRALIDDSRDTVTEDQRKPDAGRSEPKDDKNGQPQSGSPADVARVALDRASLMVDGEEQPLGPGMAVTAEIKTGSRRIIDYLLSPIKAYRQGSFTER